jgi:UDPglucose 6-dehydrogenase
MEAREKQAENLAIFLMKQKLPIIIMGKTYKPGVPYVDGSYSVLIENILRDKYGVEIAGYIDHELDIWDEEEGPYTYLIAHPTGEHYVHPFKHDSIIVDPWRDGNQTACEFFNQCKVIRYGRTR